MCLSKKCDQKLFSFCSSRVGFHDEIVSECESLITLHKLLLKSDSTLLGCLSKKLKIQSGVEERVFSSKSI